MHILVNASPPGYLLRGYTLQYIHGPKFENTYRHLGDFHKLNSFCSVGKIDGRYRYLSEIPKPTLKGVGTTSMELLSSIP